MYTRFYDNTTVTRLVKQLVATTNVPFVSTWTPGNFAIRGMVYLSADNLWLCQHTGYPESLNAKCTIADHARIFDIASDAVYGKYDASSNQYTTTTNTGSSEDSINYFKRISPYVFGDRYYNVTGSYSSNILGYDSTTHYYLGQYLRMMRDIYNLDLMPLYNCFDGTYIYDIDFDTEGNVFDAKEDFYKIYSVPVKFGKTYQISIDSGLPVETMCVIYGPKGVIKDKTQNLNNRMYRDADERHSTYRKFNHTQFRNPVTYTTKSWHQVYNDYVRQTNGDLTAVVDDAELLNDAFYDQGLGQFERYLRLLIKVPRTNTSSLVVIEGDYSIDPYVESLNTNNVTWANQSGVDVTVNSQTTNGEWIRPDSIVNNETKKLVNVSLDTEFPVYHSFLQDEDNTFTTYDDATIRLLVEEMYGVTIDTETDIREQNITETSKPPMFSPLGLLQMSDGNHYAFSDRLVEYLLQHAINHLDSFGKNIQRIQEYATSTTNRLKNGSVYRQKYTPGVWDESLQQYLFELVRTSTVVPRKVDITGYVDKDVEKVITRGQNV